MSQEIKEYILNNYQKFTSADVLKDTDYSYSEISQTIVEMEQQGLIYWREDKNKYIQTTSVEDEPAKSPTIEIKEYIMNHYKKFTPSDVVNDTDFPYADINEVIFEMDKEALIKQEENKEEYVVITERNFKRTKQELKEFADSIPNNIEFETLKKKGKTLRDRANISDVNKVTQEIQGALKEQNDHLKKLYDQIGTVYNTFDALDKDYIQRILVNLNAAEEANRKAIQGLEENKKIVESQKTVIEMTKGANQKIVQEIEESKAFQERTDKNIQYLWAGFIVNAIIVLVLFALIISGVL